MTEEVAGPMHGNTTADRSLALLRSGDWRSVISAALPVLLAAVLGAQLVLLSVWLVAGDAGSAVGGLGAANYLRGLAGLLPTAFLAGVRGDFDSDGFSTAATLHAAPLGTTALVLGTAWFAVRRSARGDRGQRITLAIRTSTLVALLMLTAALVGRIKLTHGGGTVHADPLEAFFAPLLLMLAVCLLATREAPLPRPTWLARWLPSSRPALVGIATALVLGWMAVFVAALLETRGHEGTVTDVLKLIPGALAFGPTVGQAGAHVGMLGSIGAGVGSLIGTSADIGLFERHGLSAWYWCFVLIPLLAIPVAIRSAVRAAGTTGEMDSRAAAVRVAVPFALYWTVLALLTRLRVSAVVFGSSVGIPLWQALALPLVIVPVLGWLTAVRLRGPTPAPSPRRLGALTPITLALGYGVLCVALAGGAAAAQRLSDGSSLLTSTSSAPTFQDDVSVTASAGDGSVGPVEVALENAASAEKRYHDDFGSYTDDESQLDELGGSLPGVSLDFRRADDDGFCIVGLEIGNPDSTFTYDSTSSPELTAGESC